MLCTLWFFDKSVLVQHGGGISRALHCPKQMVGRVIGKGGETIKALQNASGARIQIDQSTDPMLVTLTGSEDAVARAEASVTDIINGGSGFLTTGSPGCASILAGADFWQPL